MIQYRVLMGESRDEIEREVEKVINDDTCNWKLHEGLVVVPRMSGGYFTYFQAVTRETIPTLEEAGFRTP
jgi:hypothetical protein